MIHIGVDTDLCIISLEDAEIKLKEMTKDLSPAGLIVSETDRQMSRDVLNSKENWKDVQLTILEFLPYDSWILYNARNAIFSNGA